MSRDQRYATPQLPTRLPEKQYRQKRLADEKQVNWKRVAPPQPVTLREYALPAFSSLTAHERECGFSADEVTYKGLVVRRLLYRGVPVFYAALGHCCRSLVKLQEAVNRG